MRGRLKKGSGARGRTERDDLGQGGDEKPMMRVTPSRKYKNVYPDEGETVGPTTVSNRRGPGTHGSTAAGII